MRLPHLFEFMDLPWLPSGLRSTLRDILECGNARPFRGYYDWVTREVIRVSHETQCSRIVELGAGTAPITRLLAQRLFGQEVTLSPCDLNPDVPAFQQLERQYPGLVKPIYDPVDFSKPMAWGGDTLIFLSATLHHVPSAARGSVLRSMIDSKCRVMVFEPLNKNWPSFLFVVGSIVPALLVPLMFLGRPGTLRRILWCWLIPVAPLMFWWDGWITCLREWSRLDWREQLASISTGRAPAYQQGLFTHAVFFS